jgi:hypothetical protein
VDGTPAAYAAQNVPDLLVRDSRGFFTAARSR